VDVPLPPGSRTVHDLSYQFLTFRNWDSQLTQPSRPSPAHLTAVSRLFHGGQSQRQRQRQSYFMTGCLPPISSSWRQVPWDSLPAFLFNWAREVIALMWHPLWREDGSVVYNCCWSSPAQSFWGPSPTGLMTTFYCLRLGTPPTWRARYPYLYPPLTGWPSYTPRHWISFSSLPTTHRATAEVFVPPPSHGPHNGIWSLLSPSARIAQKTYLPLLRVLLSGKWVHRAVP
jgi:hypothetical protein